MMTLAFNLLSVAAALAVLTLAVRFAYRSGSRLTRRRLAIITAKESDDLMAVAQAAGVDNPCPMTEPTDVPLDELLGVRRSDGLVAIGNRLVHPQCAAARRDARPERICGHCYPALGVADGGRIR